MPSSIFHQNLTAQALRGAGVTDCGKLATDYCCYPDMYFGEQYPETEPYIYFYKGIQFHYPPHTPVEEFYRYWTQDENGSHIFLTRKNENVCHVEAGFHFYLNKVISLLKENNAAEAYKFLGCLLHFLEDATFGLHVLEGADGTDLFVLDRLTGEDIARYIVNLPMPEELKQLILSPCILSDNIPETVALLYDRYVRISARARQLLFDIVLEHLTGKSRKSTEENLRLMYTGSLQLVTDTIGTILALASGKTKSVPVRQLTEFSPFHYPIGGSGGFGLRRYTENREENIITFGDHCEAYLLYSIPRDLYKHFTVSVTGEEIHQATLHWISDGKICQSVELKNNEAIPLSFPVSGGDTGFKITSSVCGGRIKITDGLFHRF